MSRQQANRAQPTIVMGRHLRAQPDTRPGPREQLAARVERDTKLANENRELKRQLAAEQLAREADKYQHHIDDVVLPNSQAMHLDKVGLTSLDNSVGNALRKHRQLGLPLKDFPVYDVISNWKARHGRAQPPPPKNASPLDAALPPPRQEGRTLPEHAKSRDAAMRESQERGARQREQVMKDREAYQKALAKYGLADPSLTGGQVAGSGGPLGT